ncbi:hypothetical protein Plhal304r1_c028g0093971 [Plasmopara halstedii]
MKQAFDHHCVVGDKGWCSLTGARHRNRKGFDRRRRSVVNGNIITSSLQNLKPSVVEMSQAQGGNDDEATRNTTLWGTCHFDSTYASTDSQLRGLGSTEQGYCHPDRPTYPVYACLVDRNGKFHLLTVYD